MTIPGVIDFHVHVGDFDRMRDDIKNLLEGTASRRDFDMKALFSDPKGLAAYLRDAGVVRTVLVADEGPGVNYVPTTDYICDFWEAAQEDKDFFIPFGNINPNRTPDVIAKYESDLKRGIKGYKLYPADHDFHPITPELMEFYGRLEADGLILMFHTGTTGQDDGVDEYGDPKIFLPILQEFPELTVVFCHAGKPIWTGEATEMARTYPNLYLDTAFIKPEKLLVYLPELADISHKVLFGSDWPVGVSSLSAHLKEMRELGLPEEAVENLFYRNAARLLSLD